jgi:hypothetical protein
MRLNSTTLHILDEPWGTLDTEAIPAYIPDMKCCRVCKASAHLVWPMTMTTHVNIWVFRNFRASNFLDILYNILQYFISWPSNGVPSVPRVFQSTPRPWNVATNSRLVLYSVVEHYSAWCLCIWEIPCHIVCPRWALRYPLYRGYSSSHLSHEIVQSLLTFGSTRSAHDLHNSHDYMSIERFKSLHHLGHSCSTLVSILVGLLK